MMMNEWHHQSLKFIYKNNSEAWKNAMFLFGYKDYLIK